VKQLDKVIQEACGKKPWLGDDVPGMKIHVHHSACRSSGQGSARVKRGKMSLFYAYLAESKFKESK